MLVTKILDCSVNHCFFREGNKSCSVVFERVNKHFYYKIYQVVRLEA